MQKPDQGTSETTLRGRGVLGGSGLPKGGGALPGGAEGRSLLLRSSGALHHFLTGVQVPEVACTYLWDLSEDVQASPFNPKV